MAPGQGTAAGLRLAEPGAAVLRQQQAFAAQRPAESAAVADAGLWPAAVAAAAAGKSSVSAAVESFLGTLQGTGKLLVAGLLGVLPETKQEKGARNEKVNKNLSQ